MSMQRAGIHRAALSVMIRLLIKSRLHSMAAAFVFLFLSVSSSHANVTVTEGVVTLKTWNEGLPNTNPYFEVFSGWEYPAYPYAMRDNFGSATSDVAWRQVT